MCGRTAVNFNEEELREELARAHVRINQIINQPAWRRTHNVAPTYNQPVIRQVGDRQNEARDENTRAPSDHTAAKAPSSPKSPKSSTSITAQPGELIVQSMRWGLIPFWSKRMPDYSETARTINARDDSLFENRGMWNAFKGKYRCVIPVMGYYEWLKKGAKEKIPHFTKRADGQIMLLAGLWSSVKFEDERIYSYTIITTNSAKSVSFLHDRMPVILDPDTPEFRKWLDPNEPWSPEIAKILKPYEGDLLCYPVKKEVGKVGEDSPSFIVPINSAENKSNIANFFSKSPSKPRPKVRELKEEIIKEQALDTHAGEDLNSETHAPLKREREHEEVNLKEEPPATKLKIEEPAKDDDIKGQTPVKTARRKPTKRAPPPVKKSPTKKESGAGKITNFFALK